MADAPRSWQIVQTLCEQLRNIHTADGYYTDAGEHVWDEPAQRRDDVPLGITVGTMDLARMTGERPQKRGRVLSMAVEASIPTTLDNAHELAHQLIDDVETCLGGYNVGAVTQQMPLEIDDITVLDRPEGLPVIAVHIGVESRYWR